MGGEVIKVVFVEDDQFFRADLERWIGQDDRFQCVGSYGDAETALHGIVRSIPHVAMLDLGLPGRKGRELLQEIKIIVPEVRVLVLTGILDDSVLFESLEAGADGFLEKRDESFSRNRLLEEICEVHAGGVPLSRKARQVLIKTHRRYIPKPYLSQPLTRREQEIMAMVSEGCSDKDIARKLNIAPSTINTHTKHIFEKLDTHNRTEAVCKLFGIHNGNLGKYAAKPATE